MTDGLLGFTVGFTSSAIGTIGHLLVRQHQQKKEAARRLETSEEAVKDLLRVVNDFHYFGPSFIAANYSPNSRTVIDLVNEAGALVAKYGDRSRPGAYHDRYTQNKKKGKKKWHQRIFKRG